MTGPLGVDDPLDLVRPRYFGGSLSDVLPSALAVLGVAGADPLGLTAQLAGVRRIAVLLIDGLGWYQLPIAAPYAPTLTDLAARYGRPLTCGFPSTTPTSLVSLGTGAAPGAHGVLGFRVNVPGTDRVLTHIDWSGSPAIRFPGPRSPPVAAVADPVAAGRGGRGGGDRGEPPSAGSGLTRGRVPGGDTGARTWTRWPPRCWPR